MKLRVASYNIHGGVGRDRRADFGRILAVLQELDSDVVALQEVVAAGERGDLLDELSAGTGCTALAGPTLIRESGPYGNAILTRLPVIDLERVDLSVVNREPRGALMAHLDLEGLAIHVVGTHLGLRPSERRVQIRRLLSALSRDATRPGVLMGDINEWFLWGRPLRWLHAHFGRPPSPPTFPARWPLLALDRIWAYPARALKSVRVHDSTLARVASDHLPIVGELTWTVP